MKALVDYKKRFIDVEIGWPGSVADRRIFDSSALGVRYKEELEVHGTTPLHTADDTEEEIPAFILGDSAYPNSRHIVTTYKVGETEADPGIRKLNYELSKARYRVENAFGLLKGRFLLFDRPIKCAAEDFSFAMHLIASVFVLHNFLIDSADTVSEKDVLPPDVEAPNNYDELGTIRNEDELVLPGSDESDDDGMDEDIAQNLNGREPTRGILLRHIKWRSEMQ